MSGIEGLSVDVAADSVVDIGEIKTSRNSSLQITGKSCSFRAEDGVQLTDATLLIESPESSIHLSPQVKFTGKIFLKGAKPNHVFVAAGTTFVNANIICGEGSKITIGADSMISWAVEIRTTDSHAIYDLNTGERINFASDITIGDHVWIAAKTTILKGSRIANGSIAGLGAVITSSFDEQNVMIVGNPARIVRRCVRWERPLLG